MKAIELLQQYWENAEKLLIYARYCSGNDMQTIVCRDFWLWLVYGVVGCGLVIGFVILKRVLREQLEFHRNKRRLEARRYAEEEAEMEQNASRMNAATDVDVSQGELAAAIRAHIKVRGETSPESEPVRVVASSKTSPMRELGTVMRDLAATIRQAVKARALVPPPIESGQTTERKAEASPQRELATIMLTDMVGYSGAMERNEQHTYAKLLLHNEIVRLAIANYRGREIKTIGDAFLVIFRSALDGVDCALAIQRALTEYNADKAAADQILIRIGIHLGDILITSNDVFGDGVNIAARIQPLAAPGGICMSEAVYVLVRKKFELNVQRVEGSALNLKNIAVAPDIYHLNMA